MMQVTEIFRSIQGESTYAGLPCIFVRLTGCNLRCTWCDTAYAFYGGTKMSLDDVLGRVKELSSGRESDSDADAKMAAYVDKPISLVELTGGEPLLQSDIVGLAQRLMAENYDNLNAIDTKDEVKFVIGSRRDYEFARDFSTTHQLARRVRQVLFSPVFPDPNGSWNGLDARILAEWILADRLPVRLGLQLHKFVWHPSTRGV
jgi:7-carboxy-7-deazaguanine synthase